MPRPTDFHARAFDALETANAAAWRERDPEQAVRHFTRATRSLLGDPEAASRPGAIKPGETQFVVSGIFFIAPTRDHMILFADNGFPPEQRHARISVTDSRPSHTVTTGKPAVVPNTDEDPIFRQILSSGRVGCSVYVPVMWKGAVIGMFNTAAQARRMYDETDLQVQVLAAALAAAAWTALDGPKMIRDVAARMGPWS